MKEFKNKYQNLKIKNESKLELIGSLFFICGIFALAYFLIAIFS